MLRACRGDAGGCWRDVRGCRRMLRMQGDAEGMLGVQEDAGEMQGMLTTPAPCLPLAAGVNQQQCQLCRLFGIV